MLGSQISKSVIHSTTLLGRGAVRAGIPGPCFAFSTRQPAGWSFPRHKELLTEDYYNYEEGGDANPYDTSTVKNDFEDYEAVATHRSTATGVLSTYKKKLNLTAKDVMMKDYMTNIKNLKANMAQQFAQADRANYTKTMVERLRLGRGLQSPVDSAGNEYGNYEKFEGGRNQVKEVYDKGYDDFG